jgi:hypothetical protein
VKIIIETIPHLQQRYNTVGDWQWEEGGKTLHVLVSELTYPNSSVINRPNQSLEEAVVGIHEVIEALQCSKDGITQKQVDEFDNGPSSEEALNLGMEPGDHWDSPYKQQHTLATGIERILCFTLGITWYEYDEMLTRLCEHYDRVKEEEEKDV